MMRHNFSEEQLIQILRTHPQMVKEPHLLGAVVQKMGDPAKQPKLMAEIFRQMGEAPNEASFERLLSDTGSRMDSEQIKQALDIKEHNGFAGPVQNLTRNQNLDDNAAMRITNPDKRALYGSPGLNFGRNGARNLSGERISDIIKHGDFFPALQESPDFSANHLRAVMNHPQTSARDAVNAVSEYYAGGGTIPTADLAPFIQKMSRMSLEPSDERELSSIVINHSYHDEPKIFDALDKHTVGALLHGGDAERLYDAAKHSGVHDAANAQRAVRLAKIGGPALARFENPDAWGDVMKSPHVDEADKNDLRRYQTQNFWHNYENNVEPEHFAAVSKWQQGKTDPVEVIDHRGKFGSSDVYPGIENGLTAHAKESQAAVMGDKNLPIKNIDGKPHVLMYRGVSGDYAHKVVDAIAGGAAGVKLPTSVMSSWSTDPAEAHAFSMRQIHGQSSHGVLMRRWAPVDSVLHTGFHPLEPGHEGAHPQEQELVFDHRHEPELHIPAADINLTRVEPEDHARLTTNGIKATDSHLVTHAEMAGPHIGTDVKKSESSEFVRIPLDDKDHWSNVSSELRKCPKELV